MKNVDYMSRYLVDDPLSIVTEWGWRRSYKIPSPKGGQEMIIIATVGEGWDHVSVSLKNRCPTWDEMVYVGRRFFGRDEIAYQLLVPPTEHINIHPYCLHWWRPHNQLIPTPPGIFV